MRIIGVDEVGRGCLAGDLVVVAFVFHEGVSEEIRAFSKDSKAFSSRDKREKAYERLIGSGQHVLVRRSPGQIAQSNIRRAVLSAMTEASEAVVARLGGQACEVLFDGRDCPGCAGAALTRAVIKGDAKIPEIGAASIIAKVTRDREMDEFSKQFPNYGWERNAGYGTKSHCDAIGRFGLSPLHRTWAKKFLLE